jgi:hypothetical protein
MWFSEGGLPTNCVNNIATITILGAITEYKIRTPSCNDPTNSIGGITVGSDGNIWFTDSGCLQRIPRIQSNLATPPPHRGRSRRQSVVYSWVKCAALDQSGRRDEPIGRGYQRVVADQLVGAWNYHRPRSRHLVHRRTARLGWPSLAGHSVVLRSHYGSGCTPWAAILDSEAEAA